ncbi:hypothetical protein FACS189431_0620 [Alphaproteobacteria bacterium]|nr:hypothetical protein FACS189431_0620 [Alphaproteobacteria bacterium]
MKKDQTASVVNEESPAYEKDPRFVKFIKNRLKAADDPKNRIDGKKAFDDINKKYGLRESFYGL